VKDASGITLQGGRPVASSFRRVAFYGGVVAALVAIQTSAFRVVLAGIIGTAGGEQINACLAANSQGFFVALCVALYLDVVRPRGADERSSRELVDTAISRRYGPAPGLDALASTILPSQPILRDVSGDYILEGHLRPPGSVTG
jgi:hypothetical protein